MANASITKLKEQLASVKRSKAIARVRERGEDITHTVVSTAAGYVAGRMEATAKKKGEKLPTIFDMDPKLVYGIAAQVGGTMTRGKLGDALGAGGDGMLAAYGYSEGLKASKAGAAVKGYDDDDLDEV